jgi:hypothetical protein
MSHETEQGIKLKAFVLMPFDPEFDAIFGNLIKPALEEVGYDVTRADSFLNQENILKDIVRGIAEANLVIADLTSLNANVFYELGISHTLMRPTVLLSQSSEDIPFDLKPYRVITYSTHFIDAPLLQQKLREIGEKAKFGDLGFGNPVSDYLPQIKGGIPSTPPENKNTSTAEHQQNVEIEEDEEMGVWDFVVDSERSMQEIADCVEKISTATVEVGKSIQLETADLLKLKDIRAPGTAIQVHKIATNVAMDLVKFAQDVEIEQPKMQKAWESFDENISGLLNTSQIFTKADKEGAINYRSNLDKLRSSVRFSLNGVRGFKDTTLQLRGLNKDMNRAIKRTARILDLLISDLEGADSFCTKTITLLEEKIENEGIDFKKS